MTVKLPRRILTFSLIAIGLMLVLFSLSTAVRAQQMVATYYGSALAGNPTCYGETFNPNEYTAASLDYGYNTKLIVTYDGRSVVVRVNDCGPYVKGRDLDLSRRAAAYLGLVGLGPTPVDVTVADPSTPVGPYSGNVSGSQPLTQPGSSTQVPSQPEQPASGQVMQPSNPTGGGNAGISGGNQQNNGQSPQSQTGARSGVVPPAVAGRSQQSAPQATQPSNPAGVEGAGVSGDNQQNVQSQKDQTGAQPGVGSFAATGEPTVQSGQYEQYCDSAQSSQYEQYCGDDSNTQKQNEDGSGGDQGGNSSPPPDSSQLQAPSAELGKPGSTVEHGIEPGVAAAPVEKPQASQQSSESGVQHSAGDTSGGKVMENPQVQQPAENASGGKKAETASSGAPQSSGASQPRAEDNHGQHKSRPQEEHGAIPAGNQQYDGGSGGGSGLSVLPDTGSALPLTALAGGIALLGIGGLLRRLTEW